MLARKFPTLVAHLYHSMVFSYQTVPSVILFLVLLAVMLAVGCVAVSSRHAVASPSSANEKHVDEGERIASVSVVILRAAELQGKATAITNRLKFQRNTFMIVSFSISIFVCKGLCSSLAFFHTRTQPSRSCLRTEYDLLRLSAFCSGEMLGHVSRLDFSPTFGRSRKEHAGLASLFHGTNSTGLVGPAYPGYFT